MSKEEKAINEINRLNAKGSHLRMATPVELKEGAYNIKNNEDVEYAKLEFEKEKFRACLVGTAICVIAIFIIFIFSVFIILMD